MALSLCVASCGGSDDSNVSPPPGAGGSSADASGDGASGNGAEDGFVPIDTGSPDSQDDCPQGCDEGEICSHGVCVLSADCETDDDCWYDSYCDPPSGCVPWGSPEDKTHDPNCIYETPPGIFAPKTKCEFSSTPLGDPFPSHLDVQATPMVADFDGDGGDPPSIVVPFTATVPGSYSENLGVIRVLRGTDCALQANLGGTDLDGDGVVDWIRSASPVAIGDLDLDGVPEVVAYAGDETTLAFTRKAGVWSLLWKAKGSSGENFASPLSGGWAGASIHDLDDDGVPEVIREGYVISAAGVVLTGLPDGYVTYSVGLNPVLANLDQDPAIELTNGQLVWEYAGGGWVTETLFPATASAGFAAVADFGAFGASVPPTNPEIAVVSAGNAAIWAIDGTPVLATLAIPGGGGGNPTVADYDGDGLPELGVAGADYYTVFDIDCTAVPRPGGTCGAGDRCDDSTGAARPCPAGMLWSRKTQDHSSNITGSSVFDFEADGKAEVVYADECFVRVYAGQDGAVIFSRYRSSCTWCENPVVADVDGNYRADLVVPSNLACSDGVSGIACGGLSAEGVDMQFAGIRCMEPVDCISGVCDSGYCRCTSTAQCCAAQTDAECLEWGTSCVAPPAGTPGTGNTCRAAHPHGVTGIRVYSDAADKWVRSRTIWSQHAYAVTHIREDGTIPTSSAWKNNWEQQGLNNYRQNVPGTANGQLTGDPTAGVSTAYICGSSGVTLQAPICNRGSDDIGSGLVVGFYVDEALVCKAQTAEPLGPGECEIVACLWDNPPTSPAGAVDVTVVANDGGANTECKAGNNVGLVRSVSCTPVG